MLRHVPPRHALLAVAVAVVWGVNFVVIHVGLQDFPPLLFAALRFTLVALPAVFLVGRPRVPARAVIGVGLFVSAGQFGLLFTAIHEGLPAGLASLVLQLQAVFTVALAVVVLGERPGARQLAGSVVALSGIGIIAVGRAEGIPLPALALCVGAAASWGVGNVITRHARPPDALALLVWSSLVPPIPLAGLSLALDGPARVGDALAHVGAGGLLALAYIVVASTFFGYGVWTWLLARYPASTVAPFTLLVPVVGITAAWLSLGERPNAAEMAGAAVVLGGLGLTAGLHRPRHRGPPAVAVPEGPPVAAA
jgi:O-acetylserine/cysteine efflux transporter